MEDYEEDEAVDDEAEEDLSFEEDEEDDPKDIAFMRGVEEAVQIQEETEEEEVS